jgi:CRP-like cAMP-binding protein
MTEPARSLLTTIHIFAGLAEDVIDSLSDVCQERRAEAGEIILRQMEVGREMFVMAEGEVEIVRNLGTPDELLLATLGPGEFFGEMCILECMPRSATVRATVPTRLYSLRNTDLLRLFQRWPDQYGILMLNIARDLCRRLRGLQENFAARSC